METCEFIRGSCPCSFLPYYRVGVGTRQASAQLACKRHLAGTCDELYMDYAAEGLKNIQIVVTPL